MIDALAVDVVLLPTAVIMDKIIGHTSNLNDGPTVLNNSDCLPHISLAMGVLKQTDISAATEILKKLATDFNPQEILILKTNYFDTPASDHMSELVVDSSPGLIKFHLAVMLAFKPLLTHDNVQTAMFVTDPPVAKISTYWPEHYYDKKGPNDFYPHITLGAGKAKPIERPFEFTTHRLALCHLGTFCTCRKILAEVALEQPARSSKQSA